MFNHYIFNHLKQYVKGQDDSLRRLTVALDLHKKRIDGTGTQKENILISGPSGCGKTETIRAIKALELQCPIIEADAMAYSPSAWRGKDIEDMFTFRNVTAFAANHAIIVLDEFDKVLHLPGYSHDYQSTLLKLVEGRRLPYTLVSEDDTEEFDLCTDQMLFILMGAFDGLLNQEIGFSRKTTADRGDYISYGIMPELMGRTPVCCHYRPMTTDIMMDIMLHSKKSIYREWQLRFQSIGVKLELKEGVLRKIAEDALKEKIGARGLIAVFAERYYPVYYKAKEGDIINW